MSHQIPSHVLVVEDICPMSIQSKEYEVNCSLSIRNL